MLSGTLEWVHDLWRFYLAYTQTATHAATAAAFAIFGLLVFVDPLFALLAIGSYVVPPLVLYVLEDEPPRSRDRQKPRERARREKRAQEQPGQDRSVQGGERPGEHMTVPPSGEATLEENERGTREGRVGEASSTLRDGNGDTDSDSDDGDTDSDSDDGDTDSDSDDGDTDSDSDDGDTDSDSDDGDTDSDSDDGDTDSDSDDGDTDSDS
ncbi:hypothetical protein [Halostagnicola sp. A-GB9-2]|uniref:hypothetical protein n=1 Tax=Halostagnicola sp. A-GB9-2 TaxID=3048066 RepID=UPI0024C029BC|nr:hypothetical protein [Halostagnicola sp. A-GB9-2]MDJ1430736.1 hypothetical protein [Halostagnicola sp. A-GB9-2]